MTEEVLSLCSEVGHKLKVEVVIAKKVCVCVRGRERERESSVKHITKIRREG